MGSKRAAAGKCAHLPRMRRGQFPPPDEYSVNTDAPISGGTGRRNPARSVFINPAGHDRPRRGRSSSCTPAIRRKGGHCMISGRSSGRCSASGQQLWPSSCRTDCFPSPVYLIRPFLSPRTRSQRQNHYPARNGVLIQRVKERPFLRGYCPTHRPNPPGRGRHARRFSRPSYSKWMDIGGPIPTQTRSVCPRSPCHSAA